MAARRPARHSQQRRGAGPARQGQLRVMPRRARRLRTRPPRAIRKGFLSSGPPLAAGAFSGCKLVLGIRCNNTCGLHTQNSSYVWSEQARIEKKTFSGQGLRSGQDGCAHQIAFLDDLPKTATGRIQPFGYRSTVGNLAINSILAASAFDPWLNFAPSNWMSQRGRLQRVLDR